MIDFFDLIRDMITYVVGTLWHNAPALSLGILVATMIRVYIDPEAMRKWLMSKAKIGIPTTVAFGAFTPFCACGTMAVVVSMLATSLPWGPVMAFLTSSPLMSPDEFVMVAGVLGRNFAIALTIASVAIGLGSGYISNLIERRTKFLSGQIRFSEELNSCSCSDVSAATMVANKTIKGNSRIRKLHKSFSIRKVQPNASCCSTAATIGLIDSCIPRTSIQILEDFKLRELCKTAYEMGIIKILPYFTLFAGIGYLVNRFIPSEAIMTLFSSNNPFAIPLSALIGLPLYVTGPSSLPLIQALLKGGATEGAMLAFMITGPGTSAGVIAGITTIMHRKALALYLAFILIGGIVSGYAYDLFLKLGA